MKYGRGITFTNSMGGKTTCRADNYDCPEEAKRDVIELAKAHGWTPPKWWQWWRWGDTRIRDL